MRVSDCKCIQTRVFSLDRVSSVSDAFVGVKETIASSHWLFLCIIDGILLRQIELYSFCLYCT